MTSLNDAALATELDCSIKGWDCHLLATYSYNRKYGMSYSSIGEIQAAGIGVEIDEIVGCCNWKADELRYYFNRKNIQLLRASDNRRKSRYVSAEEKQAKKDEIDGVSNSD